jgi:hypothetical protein
MNIIHGMNKYLLPRFVQASLEERLKVMPAVVVSGARQTGKSTLVRDLVPGKRRFNSLDDLDVHDAARRDQVACARCTGRALVAGDLSTPGSASGWWRAGSARTWASS